MYSSKQRGKTESTGAILTPLSSTAHGHPSASRGTSDEDLAAEKTVPYTKGFEYVETVQPLVYANRRRSSASTSGAGLSPIAEPLHSTGTTPQRPRPTHLASASGATAALTTSNEVSIYH